MHVVCNLSGKKSEKVSVLVTDRETDFLFVCMRIFSVRNSRRGLKLPCDKWNFGQIPPTVTNFAVPKTKVGIHQKRVLKVSISFPCIKRANRKKFLLVFCGPKGALLKLTSQS